ncbi:MAG: thioredoxin family protein [Tissierellia bacterium]|nr:thioredoxin family protein [Tissierellia bacterium]
MSLFNFKNKGKMSVSAVSKGDVNPQKISVSKTENIKVLGSGCAKCQSLEKATIEALNDLGQEPTVEHVTDFAQIASYGVLSTPALVIDNKVVSYGKVLKKDEVIDLIKKARP